MSKLEMTRRGFVAATACAMLPTANRAAQQGQSIQVFRDPNCGCCGAWIEILERNGFLVTTELRGHEALVAKKIELGVPAALASCHTAVIEGYVIEGHVPVADIRRLLALRPNAVGLTVPGMPFGSPGMGPENAREAYDVFLFRDGGAFDVFSHYQAA